MRLVYNLLILLYFYLIKFFSLFNRKAKEWVKGRENQVLPNLEGKRVIWMHSSSLGEYEQGNPVFEKLKTDNPNYVFVLSFFSPSGYEKLKNKNNVADYILYLPIDLPLKANDFISKINPEICIFVKYDFWYNYLNILNKKKISIIFISVLLSENHRLFKTYNKIILNQLKLINQIFTQNLNTKKILENIGFNNVEKVGDTRIDRVIDLSKSNFKDKIIGDFIKGEKKVLICGSTWEKDIDVLSKSKNILLEDYKLIIAPHENSIKQIKYIQDKFSDYNAELYSKITSRTKVDILIIDIIGILSQIYRYSDLVYIGGGFGKSIHNTLEPASYHLPVIFGPNYKKFQEAVELVNCKSFFSIENDLELKEIVLSLSNDKKYKQAQIGIKDYLENNQNASKRIVEYIERQMNN